MKSLWWAVLLYLTVSTHSYAATPFQEIKEAYQESDAVLVDRDGEVIHQLRVDPLARRLDWISLKDISPTLLSAIIFAEDRRFYQHHGVDWLAVCAALLNKLAGDGHRGGSTLSMQLASILNKDLRIGRSRRSLGQKWTQVQEAWKIEDTWSKAEILEAYLNLVTFRGELQGIASASRGIFGKEPHGLMDWEAWVLASLLRSPNASIEKVAERACSLGKGQKLQIDCVHLASTVRRALSGPHVPQPRAALAPHVALRLLRPNESQEEVRSPVRSTLDRRLQSFAIEVLRQQLLWIRTQNVRDGAVLVVDNKSGEVLAYVGSTGDLSSARYVDGVLARRQAGSTLKPFLYALAFDSRILTPASVLKDTPLDLLVPTGIYRPRNYDGQFRGLVAARTALASSLNIPAVKTLELVGADNFVSFLRRLGFADLQETGEFYGPSLALGSADVTLWELVNAYRTLANAGQWTELKLIPDGRSQTSSRRVLSREAAFLVSHILSDRGARSETFGFENPLSSRFWSAAKTGTSKDMRDNWCVGYSSRYTVGVWIGNFSGDPMWNVSGVTGAAPAWSEIMNWLHREDPSEPKQTPTGVVTKKIRLPLAEAAQTEWFIKGTEPNVTDTLIQHPSSRILYPVAGTVIAPDPDIPEDQQRLFFEAEPRSEHLRWILNGVEVGPAGYLVMWKPHPGNHTLSLVDGNELVLDSLQFRVRGAEHAD